HPRCACTASGDRDPVVERVFDIPTVSAAPMPFTVVCKREPRGNRSRARLMDSPRPLPWEPDPRYRKAVACSSMEYAIDQALKIYAGGLGFLAGSHMRSAHDLQQNLIGIGILWKYGYYDQVRQDDQCMRVQFIRKYSP